VQTIPQAPQLSASELVSTQTPLQTVNADPQPQLPAAHISPGEQAMPHAEQFIASVCKSTQAFMQFV
jgi:hypothetical protein